MDDYPGTSPDEGRSRPRRWTATPMAATAASRASPGRLGWAPSEPPDWSLTASTPRTTTAVATAGATAWPASPDRRRERCGQGRRPCGQERQPHLGAPLRRQADLQLAPGHDDPVAHARQPLVTGALLLVLGPDAATVVLDRDRELLGAALQGHGDVVGPGVLAGVDHRLHRDAVGRDPLGVAEAEVRVPVHLPRHVGVGEDHLRGCGERRAQPGLAGRGLEVEEEMAQPVGGAGDSLLEVVDGLQQVGRGSRDAAAEPPHAQIHHSQRLHRVVVHVGRDPRPLGLLAARGG